MPGTQELSALRALVKAQAEQLRTERATHDLNFGRLVRLADCVRLCVAFMERRAPGETQLLSRCRQTLDDVAVTWSFLKSGELESAGRETNQKRRPLRSEKYTAISGLLKGGPRTVKEIAARLGLNPGTAYNVLRLGQEHGLFEQLPDRQWKLTDES